MERLLNKTLKKIKIKHYPVLAMVLSIVITSMAFGFTSVAPGGYRMLYINDFYSEYLNFLVNLKHIMQAKQSAIYSWNIDMGMGIMGLNAYYMASPFNYLILFLKESHLIYGMVVIVIIRNGLAAMTAYICLKHIYLKLSQKSDIKLIGAISGNNMLAEYQGKYKMFIIVLVSVCYSMCGWLQTYFFNVIWQDALFIMPLAVYFVLKLVDEGKITGLIITWAYIFLSNYYMGYMIGVCSTLFFIFYLIIDKKEIIDKNNVIIKKKKNKKFKDLHPIIIIALKYMISAITAILISGFVTLPSLLQLLEKIDDNKEVALSGKMHGFYLFGFLNGLYAGTYTSLEKGNPPVYTGILTLLLAAMLFTNKNVKKRTKIIAVTGLAIGMVIMMLNPLNIFMHALDKPDWFNYRYAFAYSFMLAAIAVVAFENMMSDENDIQHTVKWGAKRIGEFYIAFSICVFGLYKAGDAGRIEKAGIYKQSISTIILNITIIVIMLLIYILYDKKRIVKRDAFLLLIAVITIEECVSFGIIVNKEDKESGFFNYEYVQEEVDFLKSEVTAIEAVDKDFYRIESNHIVSHNDAYAIGYRGITSYSSVCNYRLNKVLLGLGIKSNDWHVEYEGGTTFLESIMNIKYRMHFTPRTKFSNIKVDDDFYVEKNDYYLPVAFGVNKDILNYEGSLDKKNSALNKQNDIIKAMTGISETHKETEDYEIKLDNVKRTINKDGTVTYKKINKTIDGRIQYEIPYNDKEAKYYFSYFYDYSKGYYNGTVTTNSIKNNKSITLGDSLIKVPRTIYINDNVSDKEDCLIVTITFEDNIINLLSEGIYKLDMADYDKVYEKLSESTLQDMKYDNTSLEGSVIMKEDGVLFTSIPFDKGWRAFADGKAVKTEKLIDGAFLGIKLDKGEHRVSFKYYPKGLKSGALLTALGLIILYGLYYIDKSGKSKHR